jgi:hypothetical protein
VEQSAQGNACREITEILKRWKEETREKTPDHRKQDDGVGSREQRARSKEQGKGAGVVRK